MGTWRAGWSGTLACGLLLAGGLAWACLAAAEEAKPEEPKSNRMVCGECPEGYATTGVTTAPDVCKDAEEPTLYQCVPLGGRLLAVCGSCPEGYSTVGTSGVPSRCGSEDGGLMSQCQRQD